MTTFLGRGTFFLWAAAAAAVAAALLMKGVSAQEVGDKLWQVYPGHNDVVQLRLRRSGLVWNHHLHPPDRVQDTKGEVGSVAYRLWYPTWPII